LLQRHGHSTGKKEVEYASLAMGGSRHSALYWVDPDITDLKK